MTRCLLQLAEEKDAKEVAEVLKRYFGWEMQLKNTQRNLLKQQYENFTAPSSEMLDQTFDRLQKLVSQLELLDEKLSQEDVNQKLLRSLSLSDHTGVCSDQAEEGPNYALMAFSSSSSDLELDMFFNEPVVENSKAMSSEEEPKVVRKCNDAPSIKEWVSDDKEEDVSQPKIEKKTVRPSIVKKEFIKSKQQEKTTSKTVKHVEQHRQNTHSPRGNQRNWNNMMSQKLGSNFEIFNKACFMCGSFDHLQVDCNYHQK
ncbi:hypothetical protein Tco_1000249 [Tanacetum coccineum]